MAKVQNKTLEYIMNFLFLHRLNNINNSMNRKQTIKTLQPSSVCSHVIVVTPMQYRLKLRFLSFCMTTTDEHITYILKSTVHMKSVFFKSYNPISTWTSTGATSVVVYKCFMCLGKFMNFDVLSCAYIIIYDRTYPLTNCGFRSTTIRACNIQMFLLLTVKMITSSFN